MDNGVCTSNKVTAKLKVVDSSNAYIKEKKIRKNIQDNSAVQFNSISMKDLNIFLT